MLDQGVYSGFIPLALSAVDLRVRCRVVIRASRILFECSGIKAKGAGLF